MSDDSKPYNNRSRPFDAYYYSFEQTKEDSVDDILKAVAYAGKCYHHTDQWSNPDFGDDGEPTNIDMIQEAANAAASAMVTMRAENAELKSRLAELEGDGDGE
jgi:hypothetical protein